MRQKLLLSAALFSMAVGSALAQTTGAPPATGQSPTMGGGSQSLAAVPNAIMGSKLMDVSVKNQADETIGEIDDVLIDQQGKIQQVVISTGGVLGMGGKKVVLPWDQVRYDASKQVAVVSMDKEQLKSLPEFQSPARSRDTGSAPARAPAPAGTTGTGGTGTTRP